MEALLWSFTENLRGTHRLAKLGLLEEEDWRRRVEGEVTFYFSDRYSRAWWRSFGDTPSDYMPDELRLAINETIANDDSEVVDYILRPRLTMESAPATE